MKNTAYPQISQMARIRNWLIGFFTCPHRNESWPIRGKRECLDCGRVRYDFLLMPIPPDPLRAKTRQAV